MPLPFAPDQLALVHVTARPPVETPEGLVLDTGFHHYGGHAQEPEKDRLRLRQTLHFTLQSAVTDHAYGSFEGRQWAVVAPLENAVKANGRPESVLASDVAFFPKEGQMVLPGGILVEFANDLPPDVFIQRAENGTLRVSTELGGPNLSQARQWFAQLGQQGHDVSAMEQRLAREDHEWTAPEITEAGISAALAAIHKPTLHRLAGIEPGSAMGFDGWMPRSHLVELKEHLERWAPAQDMGPIAVDRHDGLSGDRLMRAVSLANPALLQEIADAPDAPPRIREEAQRWGQSPLFHRQRAMGIWRELREGPSKITNDLGQERPGLVGTFFGRQAIASFAHPRLGEIRAEEVDQVVRQASAEQRDQLLEAVLKQNTSPEGLPPAYQRLAQWLNQMGARAPLPPSTMEHHGALPPPPPMVAASGADVALPTIAQWRQMRAEKDLLAAEDLKAREEAERKLRQRGATPMLGG